MAAADREEAQRVRQVAGLEERARGKEGKESTGREREPGGGVVRWEGEEDEG